MRTFFALTMTTFLTSTLFANEPGSVLSLEDTKAAQETFIHVYRAVPARAVALHCSREYELQNHVNGGGGSANILAAGHRTYAYLTLVRNDRREIPFLIRTDTHYNTIAGLQHLKRQLLACAFAAGDTDTKTQLFLAYQRLSAGIKELDFALQNYTGHLHLKDTP